MALWRLEGETAGLTVQQVMIGRIPATIFHRIDAPPGPVIVIAHGFAGSQQLMLPFATTLARHGYVAVTFDFPGHGRNTEPLRGGIADPDAATASLTQALDQVVTAMRGSAFGDGRLALLGHSMATPIVVTYAETHPDIAATVAVSLFSPGVTATSPRDLLVIDGALEPAMLTDEAFRVVGLTSGGSAEEGVVYGSFADGTARRVVLARGSEHISVLYNQDSLAASLDWFDQVFGRKDSDAGLDHRGPYLGLLVLGLVALAYPLASLLPRVAATPLGAGLGWRRLLAATVIPALLTPLLLWKVPTDFLPILLGDYVAVHFAVYGVLTAACLWWCGVRLNPAIGWRLLLAGLLAAGYSIVAIDLPLDRYVTSLMPTLMRLPLIAAMLCGTLPYFAADEWLTHGAGTPRWAYPASKLALILSLAAAVALNPPRLFFLIIIIPVILVLFVVYGWFSRWIYRRTLHPLVAAVANGIVFAWAIAVTFPVVSP